MAVTITGIQFLSSNAQDFIEERNALRMVLKSGYS